MIPGREPRRSDHEKPTSRPARRGGTILSPRALSPAIRVWYSYCPVIHAGNVDEGLGWIRGVMKRRGAAYAFFRSVRENDFYPHYLHNLDNLFRFGGCAPAIQVKADIRRTLLLGLQWLPEGGAMLVRKGEGIRQVPDLKGRRVGLSKSLNAIKVDWWRIAQERGIELMLQLNGMTRRDVEWVDFPHDDDWCDRPELLARLGGASDLWHMPRIRRDMAFRPLEAALECGLIDACYTSAGFVAPAAEPGRFEVIESLGRYPDATLQAANSPYALTVDATLAEAHPGLVVAYLKGLIRVGRYCNANRAAAAAILGRCDLYPNAAQARRWIAEVDFVPNLSNRNLDAIEVVKEFMRGHGYIRNDVDVRRWAAPQFAAAAMRELADEGCRTGERSWTP